MDPESEGVAFDMEGDLLEADPGGVAECKSVFEDGATENGMLAQMACMANAAANDESTVAGWTLQDVFAVNHSKDIVALYRNYQKCAVIFTSRNGMREVFNDVRVNAESSEECGLEHVHTGHLERTQKDIQHLLNAPNKILPVLRDRDACPGGIYLGGHSLGGAVATLFAACVNAQAKMGGNASYDFGFSVDRLYTFGAPRIQQNHSQTRVRDQLKEDGCFEGARVFLSRGDALDPIPTLQQNARVHPLIRAVHVDLVREDLPAEISRLSARLSADFHCPGDECQQQPRMPTTCRSCKEMKYHKVTTYAKAMASLAVGAP